MEILSQWERPQQTRGDQVYQQVDAMLARIRAEGDQALRALSLQFDGFEPRLVPLKDWTAYPIAQATRDALNLAAQRIEAFARLQMSPYRDVETRDEHGVFGQRVLPLERMAAYIPGGRFPLVSTALMTLIPARVAGVASRIAVSPSDQPEILAAASLAGATGFLHMGGAQAIAAAALGCEWLEPVDMVVGPGNAYVNAAKARLQHMIKIDTLAGPSELLVLCDDSMPVEWIALDVLAQAEHDPMALSVLGCCDRGLLEAVAAEITRLSEAHPDKDSGIIQLVHCADVDAQIELANRMAPEHLHVACRPGVLDESKLRHFGSLFSGPHSAVALGDYCSGPNHTLPTLANARRKGGLQVGDFLRVLTYQRVDPAGYDPLAEAAIQLAEVEGLTFHRQSLEARKSRST